MPIHPNTRRCIHIKLNQKQCGAPALTAQPYCRFHADLATRRREVPVPILQTAADIQVAITDTIRALIEGRIHRLHAGTILFGLQLAQNGLRVGNFANIKFTGDLAEIDPAERSVIIPALENRQSVDEFEAELEREQQLEEEARLENKDVDASSSSSAVGNRAGNSAEKFAKYAARAADHAERQAIYAQLKPTAWELAMAEALKQAPREFVDSIPRDEFGD